MKCDTPCMTCISSDKCLSCTVVSGLTLYNQRCLAMCPSGFFKSVDAMSRV
jgi:hypothetical protein